MMNSLIFFHGIIRIQIHGEQAERFLNLCSANMIYLWDICYKDNMIYANMDTKRFRNLKSIAKKTKCRVRIVERKGLPFLCIRCGKHKVYLFGFLLAIICWGLSGFFIWNIRLSGNHMITDELLLDTLAKQNIHVGMLINDLKTDELEKVLRNTYECFTWVNVRRKGMTLFIDVNENTSEDQNTLNGKGDLISPFAGKIHSIITRSGTPKVMKGQQVDRGTVLVEGNIPVLNEDGTVREQIQVNADADIMMEHVLSMEWSLPKIHIEKEYTGRVKKKPYLMIGEKRIAFPGNCPYKYAEILEYTKDFSLLDQTLLDVGIGWTRYHELLETEHFYSNEEADRILHEKFTSFLETLQEKGVQILQKDVKIETYDDCWKMQMNLSVIEHIGEEAFMTYNMSESMSVEETGNLDE